MPFWSINLAGLYSPDKQDEPDLSSWKALLRTEQRLSRIPDIDGSFSSFHEFLPALLKVLPYTFQPSLASPLHHIASSLQYS